MFESCRRAEGPPPSEPTEQKNPDYPSPITRPASPPGEVRLFRPRESRAPNQPPRALKALTYDDAVKFHLERVRFDGAGNRRAPAVLRNHKSVANSFIKFVSGTRASAPSEGGDVGSGPLGDDVTVNFVAALTAYLKGEEDRGKSKRTIADRKSILWSFHESTLDLVKNNGLPRGFAECLTYLISTSGKPACRIAALAGISERGLLSWKSGQYNPGLSSKPIVQRLEEIFGVQPGTLTGRVMNFEAVFTRGRLPTGATTWRAHQKKLSKSPYILRDKNLPPGLQSEIDDLVLFHTDEDWASERGLGRGAEWRIRPNGKCPTADKVIDGVREFCGFLRLPPDADNEWGRGRGIPVKSHSLALLSDTELVIAYLKFKSSRTHSKTYNRETLAFISRCSSLLQKGTGFLRQQPVYGGRLPRPVPPHEWDDWCETNHERLLQFRRSIRKSKNRPVSVSRDPFAGVRSIIRDREHPLEALLEMTANMRRLGPQKAGGSRDGYAVFMRDLTFGEFVASYPMRVENFTGLTWVPNDPADLFDPEKRYVKTREESHLYQKSDGGFWIRFSSKEVKNGQPIDVPVAKSVNGTLLDYLLKHRPVLNDAVKRAIRRRRGADGLPPLTPEEELSIDTCPFVFRPSPFAVQRLSPGVFAGYKGIEQMSNVALSEALYRMTQRYIPDCIGFHAHSVRHLVASEYIKNHPNGLAEAAAALNISIETVERHYYWVPPYTKLRPWHDHFELLRERFESSLVIA